MKAALALVTTVLVGAGCGHPPRAQVPEVDEDATATSRAPSRAAGEPDEPSVVDDGLVLPAVRHAVGERSTLVEAFHITARAELNGASIRFDRTVDIEISVEALEVDASGEAVRERATFTIDERRDIIDREIKRTPSPIVGKTYVIVHDGDAVTVTDDRGRTPPRAEVTAVRERVRESEGDQVLERMFAGRRWYFGERIQLGAAALEAYNRTLPDPRTRYTAHSQQLLEVRDGVAVFRVAGGWEQQSDNGVLTFELVGTSEIDVATGRTLRDDLRGPVKGTLSGAAVRGEATMSSRVK